MARRDRIGELIAIKERSGHSGGRFPSIRDIDRLEEVWSSSAKDDLFASLLPARIVTLIEVFCRYWVQKLIDHGEPYEERVADLNIDVKYDLALVRSLKGQTISLGLLISNSVSLSDLGAILAVFTKLLKSDFSDRLKSVQPRLSLEHDEAGPPIVGDIDGLKRTLARLFEVRHILVHEFPASQPFSTIEIGEMIAAAKTFIEAADESLTQLLYGRYPISQHAINEAAREENETVEKELQELVPEVVKKTGSDSIAKVQKRWRMFANAEADRNAEEFEGGSASPMMYYSALKVLGLDRIKQLRSWLDEREWPLATQAQSFDGHPTAENN